MATMQKSAQEIQVEQLTGFVAKLTAEQKAKESAIKELNSQLALIEAEVIVKTAQAKAEYEQDCARLQAALAPLKDQLETARSLTQEIAKLRQDKLDATAEIKAAKGGAIKEINDQVASATLRLAAVEMAISTCKAKVATL